MIKQEQTSQLKEIIKGLKSGVVVPYLGPGVMRDVTHNKNGRSMPVLSDDLIIAMNGGKPMSPKLMYEFPRAAMNMELKKGRKFVNRFLQEIYSDLDWSRASVHQWLKSLLLPYVIDINRDTQLQQGYMQTPHNLIRGISRIGGTDYRFRIDHYNGEQYAEITPEAVNTKLSSLFKPMGSPLPEPVSFIASDADYVDYLTELMGGFGIPAYLKEYRQQKQYLLLGMRFTRDTERMVFADVIYGAAKPSGWALIPEPTPKEERFCEKHHIQVIRCDFMELMELEQTPTEQQVA